MFESNSDLSTNNFQYVVVNKEPAEKTNNNFMKCLDNVRKIIGSLDRSLKKTRKYEDQLFYCKSTHNHIHGTELSCESRSKCSDADKSKSSRSHVDIADSWSTLSIVRLQYQYEELSKRYESLLRAYDDRSNVLSNRETALSKARELMKMKNKQLIEANTALLTVGEKYLNLSRKKFIQKQWYLDRIEQLKDRIHELVATAERARLELDDKLVYMSSQEDDETIKLLLKEVRACNLLFLENLQLKSLLEVKEEKNNNN
ncbi:uncharacterized protein LOC126972602 [Leptidea sinapis]|uniref:uncharacterized protein LOC126972602 n=1 Tax=Leptidea sinapis TaxID=189913 RepID=UPI0021C377DD|nr:uncharacterized protein LOC126972602 [Leptidea sinapis]